MLLLLWSGLFGELRVCVRVSERSSQAFLIPAEFCAGQFMSYDRPAVERLEKKRNGANKSFRDVILLGRLGF